MAGHEPCEGDHGGGVHESVSVGVGHPPPHGVRRPVGRLQVQRARRPVLKDQLLVRDVSTCNDTVRTEVAMCGVYMCVPSEI